MGYREFISPERLEEFKKIGEPEVQAKLDAGHYSGNHKKDAILFIRLCESEREPDEQTPELRPPWIETWLGRNIERVILGVLIGVLIVLVVSWLGLS